MAFYMYVSISGEGKVLRFAMDPSSGQLEHLGEVAAPGRPAPMTASPDRQFVYVGRRDDLEVSSYRLDSATGDLELIGTAGLESDPCFMSTDRAGRFLLTAYYNAGHAAVHAIVGRRSGRRPAGRVGGHRHRGPLLPDRPHQPLRLRAPHRRRRRAQRHLPVPV